MCVRERERERESVCVCVWCLCECDTKTKVNGRTGKVDRLTQNCLLDFDLIAQSIFELCTFGICKN